MSTKSFYVPLPMMAFTFIAAMSIGEASEVPPTSLMPLSEDDCMRAFKSSRVSG